MNVNSLILKKIVRYISREISAKLGGVERDTGKLADTGTRMGVVDKTSVPIFTKKHLQQKEAMQEVTEVAVNRAKEAGVVNRKKTKVTEGVKAREAE